MPRVKIASIVEKVLQEHPKSRDSDNDLLARVWFALGLKLTKEQYDVLQSLPSSDTITRIRRKLQEQGKYKASEGIQKYRRYKHRVIRQNAPTSDAEHLERYLNGDEL